MESDYKDLLIQLLLEKLQKTNNTASILKASLVPPKKHQRRTFDRHNWTHEQKLDMFKMQQEGLSFSIIAKRLGIRKSQVASMIYAINAGKASI